MIVKNLLCVSAITVSGSLFASEFSTLNNDYFSAPVVLQNSDVASEAPVGTIVYDLAGDGFYGKTEEGFKLMTAVSSEETTVSLSGNGATGTLRIARLANTVTVSWGDISLSPSVATFTTTATLPTSYRPSTQVRSVFQMGSSGLQSIQVNTDGTVTFSNRNWSGISTSTSGLNQGTVSFVK